MFFETDRQTNSFRLIKVWVTLWPCYSPVMVDIFRLPFCKKDNSIFSLQSQWSQIPQILAQLTNIAADIPHQNKPTIVTLQMSVSRFPVPKYIFTAVSLLQHARVSVLCIKVQVVQLGTTTPDKMNTFSLSLCLLHGEYVRCVITRYWSPASAHRVVISM